MSTRTRGGGGEGEGKGATGKRRGREIMEKVLMFTLNTSMLRSKDYWFRRE